MAGPISTVAIMQPYFIPYAGYFRLFAAADLFVIYDCVQFPRRGWVHRNRLPDGTGAPRWLTLPLAKAPRDIAIKDLEFASDAQERLSHEIRRFPSLGMNRASPSLLLNALGEVNGKPVDYLVGLLEITCKELGFPFRTVRSSTLSIDPSLKGQDRILAIARIVGATTYVNPPGGRELYDPKVFAAQNISLRFLPVYHGSTWSILHRLITEDAAQIVDDIQRQTVLEC
jgi:hypothetical protein